MVKGLASHLNYLQLRFDTFKIRWYRQAVRVETQKRCGVLRTFARHQSGRRDGCAISQPRTASAPGALLLSSLDLSGLETDLLRRIRRIMLTLTTAAFRFPFLWVK
jgi:hypothetical protein